MKERSYYENKMKEIVAKWNEAKGTNYVFYGGTGKNENFIIGLLEEAEEDGHLELVYKAFEKELLNVYGTRKMTEFFKTTLQRVQNGTILAEDFGVEEKKETKEMKEEVIVKSDVDEIASVINDALKGFQKNKIDKQVSESVEQYLINRQVKKIIEYKEVKREIDEITHEQFETILAFVSMNEPVMLVGPAGTGKNVICGQVAKALGLEFYFSNAVTQEYKLTGFLDANSHYEETQFFKAFKYGGLFMLDEIDASIPEALIILNCAIANRYFDFPLYGRVNAHPDFRVIACANTFGTGASAEYVGRNQLDAATLNRFAMVQVDYDQRIEMVVATNDETTDEELVEFARMFRKYCQKNNVQHIVSYREISRMFKMVNIVKMDKATALKTCLVKGLDVDTVRYAYESDILQKDNSYVKALKTVVASY